MCAGIFVTDELPHEGKALLDTYEIFEKKATDDELARCEVLMAWPGRVRKDLLARMKSLRMVQSMAAGVDTMDFRSLPAGVQVFSNAGAYTESVAEHAWGLLLGVAKGVHLRKTKVVPRKLRGKTLLVVGGGAIGSEVARLARSLEMKTVGVSRSFKSPENFDERHSVGALADLMAAADAVVISLPLTTKTRGLIGKESLSRAKDSVVMINVGRGETVAEEELIAWLRERPESRYATDVFWSSGGRESFETKAWDLPNFAGTLHVSGLPLGETLAGAKMEAAKNVRRFLQGKKAYNEVDVAEYF
ncbi:MAG: 3-phosphoglycerate dehydrogenase [Thaumarchaeota archaeon]|nr:3-phosphoglycerate dehydrogenase [Nitrososphaerota archaeon]